MMAVYVAGAGRNRHKIGMSTNPQHRLSTLSSGAGQGLVLRHSRETPNAADVESLAHWILRDARIHGEWFAVDAVTACAAVDEAAGRVAAGEVAPARIAGRGRRPLGVVGVYVWLFGGQRERIDALVGKQHRSDFIREAIEAALKRRERQPPKA